MASATAASLQPECPIRKPVGSQAVSDAKPMPLIRQAFGADVVGSTLSPRAQLGYRVLVDHVNRGRDPRRPYDGRVFMTDETFAAELGGVSKRQAQRIRSELLAGGWICLPSGDAGGRGNSTIWYHLHPDGRPCPQAADTPLKQRAVAKQANSRRASARAQSGSLAQKDDTGVIVSGSICPKDDSIVVLLAGPDVAKDDVDVVVCSQRMTESTGKDDKNDLKDDRIDIAYKEELFQELIPELKSSTTTVVGSDDMLEEFATVMDQEIELDDGALRRLWRQARDLVADATAVEIKYFFHDRARIVYRNRRLDNPTGLMLTTVPDWFSPRRVLNRRKEIDKAKEQAEELQRQVAQQLEELRRMGLRSGLTS